MAHRLKTLRGIEIPKAARKGKDPILSVTAEFLADPRPDKIDAGVGVFRTNDGDIFVPLVVKEAKSIAMQNPDPSYIGPSGAKRYLGDHQFLLGTARLALGEDIFNHVLETDRLVAAGTVGGTSAVSVAVDTLRRISKAPIIIGAPTWGPHFQIAEKYDMDVIRVPHITPDGNFNMDGYLAAIADVEDNSAIILHNGKTHNPTGVNPNSETEWRQLGKELAEKGIRVILDTPYAGFGDGFDEDMQPGRILMEMGVAVLWAISYSKNAGLYGERVGALITAGSNTENARQLQDFINYVARSHYSSPPAYGERVMAEVLRTPENRARFEKEVGDMCAELRKRREIMAGVLEDERMLRHYGMFETVPGLTDDHVARLRRNYSIYTVGARVNLAGVPTQDVERMSVAIRDVRRT